VAEAVGASPIMVAVPPASAEVVLVGSASGVISDSGVIAVGVGVKVATIPLVGAGEAVPGTDGPPGLAADGDAPIPAIVEIGREPPAGKKKIARSMNAPKTRKLRMASVTMIVNHDSELNFLIARRVRPTRSYSSA
jgi:hypothetical protein